MSADDPLEGADIGETVTVSETTDIWVGGLEADATEGSDRIADSEVVGSEVVTDEYGDQHLRVTVESDVTKRLPRLWDRSDAPRTDSERAQARRKKWGRWGVTALTTGSTLLFGLAVTNHLMRRLSGEVTINGAGLTYTVWDLVPVVVILLLAVAFVGAMVHAPRMSTGGEHR